MVHIKYTEHMIIGVTYSRVFRVLYVFTHIALEHTELMKYIEHIITYTQRSRVFRALFILHIGQKTHIAH